MNPHQNHGWPPQAYADGQYTPCAPPQQPNGYQQQGYPQQQHHPVQMQMPRQYPPAQPQQAYPHAPRTPSQQYAPMPQAYNQHQHQHQQQPPRAQPQVVIPTRAPGYSHPMQNMQPPKIRNVQVPVQRIGSVGSAQMDGSHDRRPSNSQQAPAPSMSKQIQRSHSHQENGYRPQQRTSNAHVASHSQHREPLQQQMTPQQRVPSLTQTPSSPNRSPSVQQQSAKQKAHPQVVNSRPSSHQLTPTKHVQTPAKVLPADLSVLLLSAADEYISAARGSGALAVRNEADLQQYYKLMAAGMGCMHTVLRDFTLVPRVEAKLRLRYASLLVEETDNTTEIDDVLAKQISLCSRSRLQDLKYASLHLQARYQFKTNPRAGLKTLDKPINETETFQHIAWVYAFRFLRVSLALQIPGRIETGAALHQLHAIAAHAERRGDRAIYFACNALEAIVHLRSSAADRLEHARRAVAAARSLQLQVSAKQIGSFGTLIDFVDLACSIQQGCPDSNKSDALFEAMLSEQNDSSHSESGVFTVLIERSSGGTLTADTGGVFRRNSNGMDELVFAWLPKEELRMMCFYIGALDQHVHDKGLTYAKEAHQRSQGLLRHPVSHNAPLATIVARMDWNRAFDWQAVLTIGLTASYRENHTLANDALAILSKRVALPPYDNQDVYTNTLSFFSGIIDQRNGFLDSAVRKYSSNTIVLPERGPSTSASTDLAILAALNKLLVITDPAHPQSSGAAALIAQLQSFCQNHPNQYVRIAYQIVHAVSYSGANITRKKTLTQQASTRSNEIYRATKNREFVIIALCYFTASFFAEQVGEKSIQAVRASRQNAKLHGKPLWIAVALGLCMSTYQRNGLIPEAQQAQQEYEKIRRLLPAPLTSESDADADAEGEEE